MTEGGKSIRAAFGDRPASPFTRLRPLLQPHEQDVADGMRKFAAALGGFNTSVRLHIRVLNGETVEHWDIEGGTKEPAAHPRLPESADVVVVLRQETWMQIAQGRLSPFEALLSGKLRVGGDTKVAKRVVQHLSDPAMPFVGLC